MPNEIFTVCLATYLDRDAALADWQRLLDAEESRIITLRDAAIVERDDQGQLTVEKNLRHPIAKGAIGGALIGAFTPLGLIPGVLVGSIAGKLIEHFTRQLKHDDFIAIGKLCQSAPLLLVAVCPGKVADILKDTLTQAADVATGEASTDHAMFTEVLSRYEGIGPLNP